MSFHISPELQFAMQRRSSKFFQLRGGVRLSSDPHGGTGRFTRRQCGSYQARSAAVKVDGRTKKLYVVARDGQAQTRPRRFFKKNRLRRDDARAGRRAGRSRAPRPRGHGPPQGPAPPPGRRARGPRPGRLEGAERKEKNFTAQQSDPARKN